MAKEMQQTESVLSPLEEIHRPHRSRIEMRAAILRAVRTENSPTRIMRRANLSWNLLSEFRAAGVPADMDVSGRSVKSQFKLADREKAAWSIVVGDTELASNTVVLKNLTSGEQTNVPRDQIIDRLRRS